MPANPKATFQQLLALNRLETEPLRAFFAFGARLFDGFFGDEGAQMPIISGGITKTVDVTLVCDTNAYADGDVLVVPQVVAACMRGNDKTGVLAAITVIDGDDQAGAFDLVFFSASDASLGTINGAVSISDADAAKILGIVSVTADDYADLVNSQVATLRNVNLPVKPVSGTDDIYVGAVSRDTKTYTASGLKLRLHFYQD